MTRLMPYQNTGLRPCQARGQDMLVAAPVCCAPVPRESTNKARRRCTRLAWDALWCCLCRARWRWVQWATCSTCGRPSPRRALCCGTLSTRSSRACRRRNLCRPWSAPAAWLLCACARRAFACTPSLCALHLRLRLRLHVPWQVHVHHQQCLLAMVECMTACPSLAAPAPLALHGSPVVSSGLWLGKAEAVSQPVCLHRACMSATSPPSAPAGYTMTGEPPATHPPAVHRAQQLPSSHWALPEAHAYGLQPMTSRNLQAARQLPAQLLARCAPGPTHELRAVRAPRA